MLKALTLLTVCRFRCAKKFRTCRRSSAGELVAPIAPETVVKLTMRRRLAASTHSVACAHFGSKLLFFLYLLKSAGITSPRRITPGARLSCIPEAVYGLQPADMTTSSRQNRAHASCKRMTAISPLRLYTSCLYPTLLLLRRAVSKLSRSQAVSSRKRRYGLSRDGPLKD
jgi:hypothetical protein